MVNLNEIIDNYMVQPEEISNALENVSRAFETIYMCEDGYRAVYNEINCKALYYFKNYEDRPLEAKVTSEQRDYFVKIKYWRSLK